MYEMTPSKEQKQINAIVSRWVNYDVRWCILYGLAVGVTFVAMLVLKLNITLALTFLFMTSAPSPFLLSRWMARRFARRLSKDERELIVHTRTISSEMKTSFGYLQKACKINPQAEYLRASTKAEDATLLRAAAPADNNPQDQLLRPHLSDKETRS